MELKGWLMSDFEKFVESGDWYLDTQAPDFMEKLLQNQKEMKAASTPQVQAVESEDGWYEEE